MSNNCLITKLKAIIDNDNLPKFGEIRIKVNKSEKDITADSQFFSIGAISPNVTLTVENPDDGGYITTEFNGSTHLTSLTFTSQMSCYLADGDYYISLKSKYDLASLAEFRIGDNLSLVTDFSMLAYSNIRRIYADNLVSKDYGNVELLKAFDGTNGLDAIRFYVEKNTMSGSFAKFVENNPNMTTLTIARETYNISDKVSCTSFNLATIGRLTNLDYLSIDRVNELTGDISELGTLIKATKISLGSMPGITGSVESLVQKFRANGRTTCTGTGIDTLRMAYLGSLANVTFNGSAIATNHAETYLSWDETTITLTISGTATRITA